MQNLGTKIKKETGQLILKKMEENGIDRSMVYKTLGFNKTWLDGVVSGKTTLTIISLYKLAAAIHCDAHDLLPPMSFVFDEQVAEGMAALKGLGLGDKEIRALLFASVKDADRGPKTKK